VPKRALLKSNDNRNFRELAAARRGAERHLFSSPALTLPISPDGQRHGLNVEVVSWYLNAIGLKRKRGSRNERKNDTTSVPTLPPTSCSAAASAQAGRTVQGSGLVGYESRIWKRPVRRAVKAQANAFAILM
jgi:hypothetical protein